MATIGLETARRVRSIACLLVLMISVSPHPMPAADASSDARAQIAAVAEALTAGDAAEAISHFSKSLPDYEKIRRYFEGLAAFQVENQLQIADEQDSETNVTLTINWDITLTDLGSDKSRRRTGEIHAKLAPVDNKWRIVEFTPLDIFNPQVH